MVGLQGWSAVGEVQAGSAAERHLLQAARSGDRDALDQLIALHYEPLFALCLSILGHAEDAQDAVQESFLRALGALPQFRGDATFRTWLFRIAINLCRHWKRSRRPTELWDETGLGPLPGAPSAGQYLDFSSEEARERARTAPPTEKKLLEHLGGSGWGMAQMYFRLSPQEQAALHGGQDLIVSAAPEPGQMPLLEEVTRGILSSLSHRCIAISGSIRPPTQRTSPLRS